VEMTRQNVTDGPREILTNRCPVCDGDGVVVSDATHALEVERKLRAVAKGSRVQAFKVAVHPRVLTLLAGPGGRRLAALDAASRRRFFLVPAQGNGHVHFDHFEILAQGKVETVRPSAPVEEGAAVELKLVEVGLHDPTAGVGKLDGGYEVVVADAATLVGKKVSATIGCVLEGAAFATLAGGAVPEATPITFEAEAEKPMRASRAKKEAPPEEEDGAVPVVEDEVADDGEDEPAVAEPEAAAGEQPAKKRTRRGSRGGRGRKKAVAASTDGAVDAPAPDANGRPAPRIHVPPPSLATPSAGEAQADEVSSEPVEGEVGASDGVATGESDGQPKRKRSRRGSRGGRKRRKPVAEADAEADTDGAEPVAVGEDSAEAGEYVPMSEWIEDFGATPRP
jgi:predicted RNA-binding protein with TRAM domain